MWMSMLLEQIQDRVESFFQLQIALSGRQWNYPEKVNWLSAQFQL